MSQGLQPGWENATILALPAASPPPFPVPESPLETSPPLLQPAVITSNTVIRAAVNMTAALFTSYHPIHILASSYLQIIASFLLL